MLNSIRDFLTRSPPPTRPSSPCQHTCCQLLAYCLKERGESDLSSPSHSLRTLHEDYLSVSDAEQSDFQWDSEVGWHLMCHLCSVERCRECDGQTFASVTNFDDVLTFENRDVWICAECVHGFCPGRRLRLLSLCGVCRHEACSECLGKGDLDLGPACCGCREAAALEQI